MNVSDPMPTLRRLVDLPVGLRAGMPDQDHDVRGGRDEATMPGMRDAVQAEIRAACVVLAGVQGVMEKGAGA